MTSGWYLYLGFNHHCMFRSGISNNVMDASNGLENASKCDRVSLSYSSWGIQRQVTGPKT